MGVRKTQTNITATVDQAVRQALEIRAAMAGVSLSRYAAALLTQHLEPMSEDQTISVRPVRDQNGSLAVTVPPPITDHLELTAGTPLAFAPVPGGALIRPVK